MSNENEIKQYELIRIKNFKQACAYVHAGVKPIDLEYTNGKMVFIFRTKDTKEVWEKWKSKEFNFTQVTIV